MPAPIRKKKPGAQRCVIQRVRNGNAAVYELIAPAQNSLACCLATKALA
jgi:hypothetical protein